MESFSSEDREVCNRKVLQEICSMGVENISVDESELQMRAGPDVWVIAR